jgi:hypothetical protein
MLSLSLSSSLLLLLALQQKPTEDNGLGLVPVEV